MKRIVLITFLSLLSLFAKAQEGDSCQAGDCKNGYGYSFNVNSKDMYHGFYKDAVFEGIGYHQLPGGNWYFSNFKSGMPNGFTVYNEGEGTVCGVFENNQKIGPHIKILNSADKVERELLIYTKGQLTASKLFAGEANTENPCLAGNCDTGFGILKSDDTLMSGIFKDGLFVQGEVQLLAYNVSEYYKPPTLDQSLEPYFKYFKRLTPNGVEEAAHMTRGSRADGQFILINASTNALKAALFEDGEPVKIF